MAGKRIYLTIPTRDWHLLRRLSTLEGRYPGYMARIYVLASLYRELRNRPELQDYDDELGRLEREELLHGR